MKSVVIANWKMNPSSWRDAKELFEATRKSADAAKHVSVIVAPPSIYFRDLRTGYKGKKITFAAQHARAEMGGAFTGEVSLSQYKDAGASYVIIGHSEQRAMGESNEAMSKQVASAIALKLTPVLCVGERSRSEGGEYFNFVKEQLRTGLSELTPEKISKVYIAYEPVWAIGGEKTMRPSDMHEMAIFIRKTIVGLKGESGMQVKILYGGSANEENTAPMLKDGDVNGLLVGHVSIDIPRFTALLQSIQ